MSIATLNPIAVVPLMRKGEPRYEDHRWRPQGEAAHGILCERAG